MHGRSAASKRALTIASMAVTLVIVMANLVSAHSAIGMTKKKLESTVSQWAHVDALITWILIYSYDVNWCTPYSGRLGSADSLCNRRARVRVCAHWLLDDFAGSLVYQYQLASLTPPPPHTQSITPKPPPYLFFRLNHTVIKKTQNHISILYCVYG